MTALLVSAVVVWLVWYRFLKCREASAAPCLPRPETDSSQLILTLLTNIVGGLLVVWLIANRWRLQWLMRDLLGQTAEALP